ncbi:hypothetical protein [Streptomyces lavenduligriseus]|uniref:Uncharacterized protein n=1 Tax=Streptomyces lavenduligriseus TaxID=67315 RepID=A0ABT0NS97_9ACTN|nr:hypothetical protein [Streptomyces lavenduligriseus]MCL3994337.1 hypothetical protein [Streptomyces lavenduligriseus]
MVPGYSRAGYGERRRPRRDVAASRIVHDVAGRHGPGHMLRGMYRIPALWPAAYGPRVRPLPRLLARTAVRLTDFVRALALADHRPFTSL